MSPTTHAAHQGVTIIINVPPWHAIVPRFAAILVGIILVMAVVDSAAITARQYRTRRANRRFAEARVAANLYRDVPA